MLILALVTPLTLSSEEVYTLLFALFRSRLGTSSFTLAITLASFAELQALKLGEAASRKELCSFPLQLCSLMPEQLGRRALQAAWPSLAELA